MGVPGHIRRVLDELPDEALILDVGGWAEPDPRADWVIDLGAWESRGYYHYSFGAERSRVPERFTHETWVQHDICSSDPWPFANDMFDYVICTHTLEDIRDPIRACEEIARVGRAGYIETPGAATELTRGVESPLWCGWHHHRWLVEVDGSTITFIQKPHHIHSPFWPAIPSPRLMMPSAAAPAALEWSGHFDAKETIVIDFEESDAYLRRLARAGTNGGTSQFALQRSREALWQRYRRARSAVVRTARRSTR